MNGSESKQPTLMDKQPVKPQPPRPEVTVTRKPAAEEKKSTELKRPEENTEVFTIMEKRDEDQIARQLQGELVGEYFYSFTAGNREVVGLSWVGIKECARHFGNIKVSDVQIIDKEDEYQVVVKATDTVRNIEMLGVSTQSKLFQGKKDPFALQKAMSKAQRNAIRSLLPEKTIAVMLKRFKEGRATGRLERD